MNSPVTTPRVNLSILNNNLMAKARLFLLLFAGPMGAMGAMRAWGENRETGGNARNAVIRYAVERHSTERGIRIGM